MEKEKETAKKSGKWKLSHLSADDHSIINRMLLNLDVSSTEVADFIKVRYGIEVTGSAIRYRRKKVRAENAIKEISARKIIEAEVVAESGDLEKEIGAGRELAKASFQTMKQSLATIMDLKEEDFPEAEKGLYKTLKEKIRSILRRAEEFYQSVDYFGYLNYAINAQQLRVAKGMEMELTMPLTMMNVSTDLKLLVDMIEKAIRITQSLGLAPTVASGFVNNGQMIQNNQFNLQQNGQPSITERQKQMEKLKEAAKTLSPEKIEELKRNFLAGLGKSKSEMN